MSNINRLIDVNYDLYTSGSLCREVTAKHVDQVPMCIIRAPTIHTKVVISLLVFHNSKIENDLLTPTKTKISLCTNP